jgi:hypothetical protein
MYRYLALCFLLACDPKPETGDTSPDTFIPEGSSLVGTLYADAGYPMPDATVQLCAGECFSDTTDAEGAFSIYGVSEGYFALEIFPSDEFPLLVPMTPYPMGLEQHDELNLIWLSPATTTAFPTELTQVEIADGVWIEIGVSGVSIPAGIDASHLLGTQVADPYRLPIDRPGEVVDVFYTGPYGIESTGGGFPVRFDNAWALFEGTQLEVYLAVNDGTDVSWIKAGELEVVDGNMVGQVLLERLGTIVLMEL